MRTSPYTILSFTVNKMGSYWVLTLLHLKQILYWPDDDHLTVETCCNNVTWVYVYHCTDYICVSTEYNTLFKTATTQLDGLSNSQVLFTFYSCGRIIRIREFEHEVRACLKPKIIISPCDWRMQISAGVIQPQDGITCLKRQAYSKCGKESEYEVWID